MAQTCSKCSRANPADAVYCYFDGFVLGGGHARNGGPVAVGTQAFNSPFVFPTGRQCRNFNELALGCVEEWNSARDLLKQGYLETFLCGLGRIDLVMAAKEAAKFPDRDRGLDQFLNKLPSETLGEAKLSVETQEINLGVVPPGTERQFQIHLENTGLRLIYGSVACSDKTQWLTLGDTPGTVTKSIQFSHDLRLNVKVVPDRLRAGAKPLQGSLMVDTNGGTLAIRVRAEVPVTPCPAGVLGGAKSPRQVADKAKANPKGAAPLFENGTVAKWYKDNGWTYPVQGPSSSGLGAVQQFFEALGLTPPPKVAISDRKIALRGNPGEPLRYTVKVETQEKRPVFAHGTSNVPWLEVSRAKLNGRTATINVAIPAVPNRPGETLKANLVVQSNGNQRFVVPVTLEIGAEKNGAMFMGLDEPAAPPVFEAITASAPLDFGAPSPTATIVPSRRSKRSASPFSMLLHALPAVLLAFCLLLILCWDVLHGQSTTKPKVLTPFTDAGNGQPGIKSGISQIRNTDPLIGVNFNSTHRFGLLMLKEFDPLAPARKKRLTYKEEGGSNNTCVIIDGDGHLFGVDPGKGPKKETQLNDRTWETTWDYTTKKIKVRQHVEIVFGEQSQRLDTCLIWYTIENYGTVECNVGLRMMLDTFIGANDGVPFVVPGQPGLLTDMRNFPEKEIPDYVEALENPDLANPGTVAHIGLKGITIPNVNLEPVNRLLICRWPGLSELRWEPTPDQIRSIEGVDGEVGDSCAFIYWAQLPMARGEKRDMAFTYGLGKMAPISGEAGKTQLALTTGGSFLPGGIFTVTAYVKGAEAGQKIKLELANGLTLAPGESAEKTVEAADKKAGYSQVSWRVKAGDKGVFEVKATSGEATAKDKVNIKLGGIFGSD